MKAQMPSWYEAQASISVVEGNERVYETPPHMYGESPMCPHCLTPYVLADGRSGITWQQACSCHMNKQQVINEATFLANHAGRVERILRKHRTQLMGDEGMTELALPECNKAPRGYDCTKPKGHKGGCVLVPSAASKDEIPSVRRWLADQVLAFFQKHCKHPGRMVSVDILEGCVPDLQVSYCNRCGAVKTDWNPTGESKFTTLDHTWRRPDPNLWRGK